jgi:hypothetical protein
MPAIDHVRHLSETIGPRGSTTPKEREAADYAKQVLVGAGLKPETESFVSATSGWYPSALFAGLMLLACVVFWFAGRTGALLALAISLVALVSILLELAFRPNPLRWVLPKGPSQNVVAQIAPRQEVRRRIVLTGHLDSHRTPLAFSSDGWLRVFRTLVPVGLAASVSLILVFLGGSFSAAPAWRAVAVPLALAMAALFAITFQADRTPYTAGANDNATGAALVLSLAEQLAREPLTETEVWVVLTGCEEVGCYGAEAFARQHQDRLGGAAWLTLDTLGSRGGSPCFLTRETFLLTARSDPELIRLAHEVSRNRPELGARPFDKFAGAYTEGSIAVLYGFRALSLISLTPSGLPTEWHRPTDILDRLDPAALQACELFTREFLRAFDRTAARSG